MRERIRARLRVYQADAVQNIGFAVNRTKSKFSGAGRLNSGSYYRSISEDIKAGLAKYMDQSASFIRQVAPGSSAEYVDELWDAGHKLKQEIMASKDEFRTEFSVALDELIERKVEDFELGYVEGKDMTATTNNTVTITGNISNSVLQITQSGKDTISKETAQKLGQLVNSDEIKGLPENERLEVLDRVDDIVKELEAPTTDKGKVHRALTRLGSFLSSVASKTAAEIATKLAVAWAIGS